MKNAFVFPLVFTLVMLFVAGCAGGKNNSGAADNSASKITETGAENSTAKPSLQEAPRQQSQKHFLWKVSDENSSVWLLGSVHFADESFYPLDSVIENAFVAAEELAVEINISDDSVSNDVADRSMRQGMLPKDKTLNEIVPRNMWISLDSLCAAWNFPITQLMRMRPWFAATTLSVVAIQRTGIDPNYGVDVVLIDRAATEGKGIVGLETAEEQVNAVADTSDSDSAGIYYLKATLREISTLDSMVAQMVRAWKTGDEDLLRKVMNEDGCDGDSDCDDESEKTIQDQLEDKIYTSRNAKMAQSIAGFLAEDRNVFVVIGAAHLALDKDNVVSLLEKRGLKVERF